MGKALSIARTLLLAGILVVLTLIWQRMPPSIAEVADGGRDVALRTPYIRINEPRDVNIGNEPLDVNITNEPLGVSVSDQPLEVYIIRQETKVPRACANAPGLYPTTRPTAMVP